MQEKTLTLSDQEKKSPYAKYYDWKHGPLDEAAVAAYNEDVVFDPSQATSISQVNDLLKPGYLPMELGVCQFPDGGGVFANHIMMPEVTPEMFTWFMCWFPFEDVRYKIWVPGAHYAASVSDEMKSILMNPDRTFAHKLRGTKRMICEDMGGGVGTINMTWVCPAEIGFDMAVYPKEPDDGFMVLVLGANDEAKLNIILCHYLRPLPSGGSELRSRFWVGYGMEKGKLACKLPPGRQIPREVLRYMWNHNILEYSRLRDILPLLYKEFSDKPLDYGMVQE